MAQVIAEGVCVDFPLYHGSARSLKRTVVAAASGGRISKDAQKRIVVQGLRDVSFTLSPGERLGLIGSNGAGKTTLLRTLAGIYEPVRGCVRIEGTLNALLDPNLGMNPDLTGRENIALRGLFAGLDRASIRRMEEDVITFAGLSEFIHLPLRTYSSGMIVRLGFALATAIHPEILLMDEWFLAGDAQFIGKAQARLELLVRNAEILVLSSHEHKVIKEWCTRALWLDRGRVMKEGAPEEVIAAYLDSIEEQRAEWKKEEDREKGDEKRPAPVAERVS
jgi:lipopolysaccharide transport system ATP-binding protein